MVCIFELQELNSTTSNKNNNKNKNKTSNKKFNENTKNIIKQSKKIQYCGCPYTGFINKSRQYNK